jgi:hypothetical protein
MSSGQLFLITKNSVFYTKHFDGQMDPSRTGHRLLGILKHSTTIDSFTEMVNEFGKEVGARPPYFNEVKNVSVSFDYDNVCFNYAKYVYLKNLDGNILINMKGGNPVALEKGNILVARECHALRILGRIDKRIIMQLEERTKRLKDTVVNLEHALYNEYVNGLAFYLSKIEDIIRSIKESERR